MATTPALQPSARGNVYTSDRVVPRVSLPSLLAGELDQHNPRFRLLFAVTPSTAAGKSDQVRLALELVSNKEKENGSTAVLWVLVLVFATIMFPGLALRSLINFRCLSFVLKVGVKVVVILVVWAVGSPRIHKNGRRPRVHQPARY